MVWLRRHGRSGVGVALFALALQLVLSFGHAHVDGTTGSRTARPGIALSQAGTDPGMPASPGDRPGTDEYCAICATISLAASLALPQPAVLALPVAEAHRWMPAYRLDGADTRPSSRFQARAPPHLS